ncbi:Autotransporter assembly factor TamB [Roseibium album]|nr:Autotransporter assembly factor TamB [Roseibium album]
MRFLKLSLRLFAILIVIAIAVPILVIGTLQVPAGRVLVSNVVSSIATTEGQSIEVQGLFVSFGLNASIEKVSLADARGTWLSADQIRFNWHPLRILSGDLDIASLAATQINLNRLPSGQRETPAVKTSDGETSGGLSLPLNVTLKNLTVDEINLGETVLGAPVTLTASGAGTFALDPALITADLDIHRIDGINASLLAKAQFEPAAETLSFDVTVSEPRGGMAARLLEVPDLPALKLALIGSGPLTRWSANLNLALDGQTTVTGSAQIEEKASERHLSFDLDGDLARLAPPAAHAFVLGTTKAVGTARFSHDFEPRSADLTLKSQTVSLVAKGELTNGDIAASANMKVSAGENALIAVDLSDRRIAFGPLDAAFKVSGQQSSTSWSAKVDLASFQTTELKTGAIQLVSSATGADLTPVALATPFTVSLDIADIDGLTEQTKPLSGSASVEGTGSVDGANQEVQLGDFSVTSAAGTVVLTNTEISADKVSSQGRFSLTNISMFSDLVGRDLGGNVSGNFSADLDPSTIEGSATVALNTRNLITGISQANAMLAGETQIDLDLELASQNDITLKKLSLKNPAVIVSGNARYLDEGLSSDFKVKLADLANLDTQLGGSLDLSATTSGPIDALDIEADASSKQILLSGTPLDDLTLSAKATADLAAPSATVKSTASLNGQPISVDVALNSKDGGADINPLSMNLAGNSIKGALAITDVTSPVKTLSGNLQIDAPDLASLSPLLLTEVSGRLKGTLSADPDEKKLALDITGSDIVIPAASLGKLTLKANLAAPYEPESVSADIKIQDLLTDATPIYSALISAKPDGDGTSLTADVKMDEGSKDGISLAAHISEPSQNTYLVALSDLAMRYQGIASKLSQPTSITYANGDATIQPLELQLGDGSFAVSGSAGQSLDLTAELKSVPLNLANAFVPSLGLGGSLSGNLSATGRASAPAASWSISGSGLTASQLRNNGLSAVNLTSTGTLKGDQISQTIKIVDENGLTFSASGTVGTVQPNRLSLTLDGTVPVAALRRPLLDAGLRGEGAVALKGSVGGTATQPSYQITATPAGLKVTSLSTGLTVQNIRGNASVNQTQASLNGIAGDLATGGTLSASGTVGTTNGFLANLALNLNNGRYVDPGLVTAEVNADLKVTGPLSSSSASALIAGSININKADVSIPESLPGTIPPVEVRHVHASKAIRRQVAELGGGAKNRQTQQKANPPRLDILLSAPGRIFVRGRGLDAELQGNLKIVGTTAEPQAIGAFSLKRGQLDVLTRRLVFSRGTATFEGSLTPSIDFAATTTVNDTNITVTVSGEANDPRIAFTSSPELPQDEVLALLLFSKSVGNLSATQIASLAAAIATLTGGSDNGPLAVLRKSLGLDAIDINTDGEDGPSVSVGKYINDNIYLGVEQGTGSDSSRVKVDIDLDRGLKVRGEVGADGSSKAGIFFEREY